MRDGKSEWKSRIKREAKYPAITGNGEITRFERDWYRECEEIIGIPFERPRRGNYESRGNLARKYKKAMRE